MNEQQQNLRITIMMLTVIVIDALPSKSQMVIHKLNCYKSITVVVIKSSQ